MAKGAPIAPLTQLEMPLRASASVLLVRWGEIVAWSSTIHDPKCVQDLHNMRIAAKRLRYTLEIFAPVLADAEAVLRTVEELQERIGKIHDCDVLFPLLQDTLEREMKRERKDSMVRAVGPPPFLAAEGLVALIGAKRAERQTLYEEFLLWWDALPPEKFGALLEKISSQSSENKDKATPESPTREEAPND